MSILAVSEVNGTGGLAWSANRCSITAVGDSMAVSKMEGDYTNREIGEHSAEQVSRALARRRVTRQAGLSQRRPVGDEIRCPTPSSSTNGAWSLTWTNAPAVRPVWLPARPRTTSPLIPRTTSATTGLRVDPALKRYWEGEYPNVKAPVHAGAVPALRERPLRTGVSGVRHLPQRRGFERSGVQPLRWHSLLHQQLPLPGEDVQLLAPQLARPIGQPAESGRYGSHSCITEKCTFCVQRIRRGGAAGGIPRRAAAQRRAHRRRQTMTRPACSHAPPTP